MKRNVFLITVLSMLLCSCTREKSPKYILQICTGGWNNQNYTTEQILTRLTSVTELIPVEKVIIGWNLNQEQYIEVGNYLHSKGIEMFFWMPVFSETGQLEPIEESVDLWGNKTDSYNLQEGESFAFYCPSSQRNIQAVKDIYNKYFDACGFDGVFLDKIRTASYIVGQGGVLSCGCGRCKEIYRRNGFDTEDFIEKVEGGMNICDPEMQKFFKLKAGIISQSVAELAGWFHGKGLGVGLDLFAPELAMTVGQDYGALSEKADFIKPMMYRKTAAPAGIGFEMRAINPDFKDTDLTRSYLLEELGKAATISKCAVYPGIEINYRKDIAKTTPEYVSESIQTIQQAGLPGAVLAWDIMLAPDSHIRAASPNL